MHLADPLIQSHLYYILSVHEFPGNRTQDLGVASAVLLKFELQLFILYLKNYIYILF